MVVYLRNFKCFNRFTYTIFVNYYTMKCSVCSTEIKEKYCPNCGQYFKEKRVTFFHFLSDAFTSVFSLEKSFFKNIQTGLCHPQILPVNYWNGFRKYYYSPFKFFTIASLFIVLHYAFANDFLGLVILSNVFIMFWKSTL